jgi:tetratricopeptide (TPR) repeat protein
MSRRIFLLTSTLLLLPANYARAQLASCAAGDRPCYSRQYESFCASGPQATVQNCRSWIDALGKNATGDREARRAQANGYGAIAQHLSSDPKERTDSRTLALSKFRELANLDPKDADALIGMSAWTDSKAEKLEIYRRVMQLTPDNVLRLSFLVSALLESGRTEDILEAALATEKVYPTQAKSGTTKWRLATEAIDLYNAAGETNRARSLQQRARSDFDGATRREELSRLIGSDPERAYSSLELLCNQSATRLAGAGFCIDGMEDFVSSLEKTTSREQAQLLADRSADVMSQLGHRAEEALIAADPRWRQRFQVMLERMTAQGLGSYGVWRTRASLELNPTKRLIVLEDALREEPSNPGLQWAAANEYGNLGRWDEAIDFYRRAKGSIQSEDVKKVLDHNIEASENERDANRASRGGR